jgi:hypothetical protein
MVPEVGTNSPTLALTVLRLGLRIVVTANHASAAARSARSAADAGDEISRSRNERWNGATESGIGDT